MHLKLKSKILLLYEKIDKIHSRYKESLLLFHSPITFSIKRLIFNFNALLRSQGQQGPQTHIRPPGKSLGHKQCQVFQFSIQFNLGSNTTTYR